MQEKILKTISEDILTKDFNFNGIDMVYKDYLIQEVFPFIDLNSDTLTLKNGLTVSLKEFIEDAVLYICQNKYKGIFRDFAKDYVVDPVKFKTVDKVMETKLTGSGKNYVFYETYDGPKYIVNVDGNNVSFSYKDGTFNVSMNDRDDQKDFLLRIKDLDRDLFTYMWEEQEVFKKYVNSFDEIFVRKLMNGIQKSFTFDDEIDKTIEEMSLIIDSVEKGELFRLDELNHDDKKFNVEDLPRFNGKKCMEDVLKRCAAFYSEFVSDVGSFIKENSIAEKTEYIMDEYLVKIVDDIFNRYVNLVAYNLNNDLHVNVNGDFISDRLDEILLNLREILKRVFIGTSSSSKDAQDIYINIALDDVANSLIDYELLIDKIIDNTIKKYSNNEFLDNDQVRRVS